MANEIGSIFEQLKKSREGAGGYGSINESTDDSFGYNSCSRPNQDLYESTSETFTVVRCEDCGAIISALDESDCGCPVCGSEELFEKTVTVVREGKVQKRKVPTRKKKLSPAQKAALAKARKKAHTGSANKQRAKSLGVRNRKGLNDSYEDDLD